MLLPAATSITADSSSSRLHIFGSAFDHSPKFSRPSMIGSKGLLRASVAGFFDRKHRQYRCLCACNVKDDRRSSLTTMPSRRHLVMKESWDRRGHSGADKRSSGRKVQAQSCYHPSEDIEDVPASVGGGDGERHEEKRLTDAEIARTTIEVNDKAALIFSESIDVEVEHKVVWPEVSYITDEFGGIYIEVNNEDDALEISSNDNLVQVLIGIDDMAKIVEELPGRSTEDFMDEELEVDDDFEQDMEISDFDEDGYSSEDNDGSDDEEDYNDDSLESVVDWTNLETMRSSHPVYFAKKIAEAVSGNEMDWMYQPSISVVIQGFLRPASVEDQGSENQIGKESTGGHESTDAPCKRITFYKVEVITIQLASPYINMTPVRVEDYRQAQPDSIAHSAAKIISRLKSGGEKTTQALKSLCLRCKGMKVEEVVLTGVDSLGFDLRACSGTQIENLRFSFKTRATSEYSAERQLSDLLFPRVQAKPQVKKQGPNKEL